MEVNAQNIDSHHQYTVFKRLLRPSVKLLLAVILFASLIIGIAVILHHTYTPAGTQISTSGNETSVIGYPANIDYEGISNYGNYSTAALSDPNVSAVDISMNWSQVEPHEGVFNWAPADKVMADWSHAGKKFTLVLRFANEGGKCTVNQLTPSWEIAKIPNFCDTDYGVIVPDYFNAAFEKDFTAYVQEVATHIEQSAYKSNLLYVRVAVGLGGEGFPLSGKGDYATVDLPKIEAWGYTPQAWAAWQEHMLTSYKQSFHYTTVIYPWNGGDTNTVTAWAASQGMGIGQQGLNPRTNYPVFQQLRIQYPHMYSQFQTVFSLNSEVTSSCSITCVAGEDIQAAEKNGVQFIEWYSKDITNPALQPYFQQWQQYVNAKFTGTGTFHAIQPEGTASADITATQTPANSRGAYQVKIIRGIAYGPNSDESGDICTPIQATGLRPGIIYFHGGGWVGGNAAQHDAVCQLYASYGFDVYNVNYRLAPASQWPAQLGDIQLAVRFLKSHASIIHLNPSAICSDGDSAGGHLALLADMFTTIQQSDVSGILSQVSPKVTCAVDEFGPTDLTMLFRENPKVSFTNIAKLLDNQTPSSDPLLYEEASPVHTITNQTGPVLIIQGTADQTVLPDQSTELQTTLQQAHIPVQYISYSGGHEYTGLTKVQRDTIRNEIILYMLNALGSSPTPS